MIKMTLYSTSRRTGEGRSVYGRGEDEGDKVTNATASAGYSTSSLRGEELMSHFRASGVGWEGTAEGRWHFLPRGDKGWRKA